jgi:hypothetical protein
MLEIELDPNNNLCVIELIKEYSFIYMNMYLTITFNGQGHFKSIDLQLGIIEFWVYHNDLLESIFQYKFDCLRQLHTLDRIDDDKDRS